MERDGPGGCGALLGIRGGGRCVSAVCLPATVTNAGSLSALYIKLSTVADY